MPALPNVAFVVSTGGFTPTIAGPGIWDLKVPSNQEAVVKHTAADIDLHVTCNIPTGYVGLIFSQGDEPAPNTTMLAEILIGNGAAQAITMRAQNVSITDVAADDMTDNTNLAKFVLLKCEDATFTSTGP